MSSKKSSDSPRKLGISTKSVGCDPEDAGLGVCPITLEHIGNIDKKYVFQVCRDPTFYDVRALYQYVANKREQGVQKITYPHSRKEIPREDLEKINELYNKLTKQLTKKSASRPEEGNDIETNPIFDIALSPDGTKLATASNYGNYNIRITNQSTGAIVRLDQSTSMSRISWSPDSTKIAGGTGFANFLKVWNVLTGEVVKSIEFRRNGSRTAPVVTEIKWSPDGTKIAAGLAHGSGTFILNVETLDLIWKIPVEETFHISWSADSSKVAVINRYNECTIWDVNTQQNIYTMTERTFDAVWSPDGTKLAVITLVNDKVTELILDASSDEFPSIRTLEYSLGTIKKLQWSPDGTLIAAYAPSLTRQPIHVWDVASGNAILRSDDPSNHAFNCITWANDGRSIIYGNVFGQINRIAVPENVQQGGSTKYSYNGRAYVIRTGSRGGRFILVGKEKKRIYIK